MNQRVGGVVGVAIETQVGFLCGTVSQARDYYEILGVPKTATDSEIKKAFYQLAKKHHPDANKVGLLGGPASCSFDARVSTVWLRAFC